MLLLCCSSPVLLCGKHRSVLALGHLHAKHVQPCQAKVFNIQVQETTVTGSQRGKRKEYEKLTKTVSASESRASPAMLMSLTASGHDAPACRSREAAY